jgi:hypothetical protein
MNEGSTSRFYSFNIYLKPDIIYYNRSYKKIYIIAAEGLPVVNIVFIFFGIIAKIFKISSENQKLTELLFENLKEQKTFMKINNNKVNIDKKLSLRKTNNKINTKNNLTINKNTNDISSIHLAHHDSEKKKILIQNNNNSSISGGNDNKSFYSKNDNSYSKMYSGKIVNRTFNFNKIHFEEGHSINNGINYGNNSINRNNIKNLYKINDQSQSSNTPYNNIYMKNYYNSQKFINNAKIKPEIHYIKKQLFPYKYYLFSIFIKNNDISNSLFFFTKKFIIVYNFICQLFDISSYLILQREFQIMKSTAIEEKQRNIIENGQKINVNTSSFNINMRECLDGQKLSIFGRMKQRRSIDI